MYILYAVEYMRGHMEPHLGEFEQTVLIALLRLGSNAYGATVRREIEERSGRKVSFSAVYATLDRMEEKGYVRSRVSDPLPQRGGRRRKYFLMQPPGARALSRSYQGFKRMTRGVERQLEAL